MNKNDIRLLTCNNLFITYYILKKNQATKLKYKKALIKLQSNSSHRIWSQASAKIYCATRLVQPIYYNLFEWTIQTREVIWYHFTAVKWYHITSRVSFLVTALSHWYPHIICNNHFYHEFYYFFLFPLFFFSFLINKIHHLSSS